MGFVARLVGRVVPVINRHAVLLPAAGLSAADDAIHLSLVNRGASMDDCRVPDSQLTAEAWIPRTKLVMPRPGHGVVFDPALLDRLR